MIQTFGQSSHEKSVWFSECAERRWPLRCHMCLKVCNKGVISSFFKVNYFLQLLNHLWANVAAKRTVLRVNGRNVPLEAPAFVEFLK